MLAETLKLSIRTIMRNALRSILTVLGIVIGVAAVIVMVTLGQGTTAQVTSDVAKLGSNILMVRPGQAGPGPASSTADNRNFDLKDVDLPASLEQSFLEGDSTPVATALARLMRPRVVDEHTPDGVRRKGEELASILPAARFALDKAQIRFMDHRRRLQGVVLPFSAHGGCGDRMKLRIEQRQNFVEGLFVAGGRLGQQPAHP